MREKAAAAGYGWNEMHAYGRWLIQCILRPRRKWELYTSGRGRIKQIGGKVCIFPQLYCGKYEVVYSISILLLFSGSDGAYLYGEEEELEEEEEGDGLEVEVEDGLGGLLDVDEDARFLEVSQFVAQTNLLHFVCEATQEQEVVCMHGKGCGWGGS